MVACTKELAVMLTTKIRGSPNRQSVYMEFYDIPSKTIADLMHYEVREDELVKGMNDPKHCKESWLRIGSIRLLETEVNVKPQVCSGRWD